MRILLSAAVAIAAMTAMTACADSRPVAPPPPVSVSLRIILRSWSWIQERDLARHGGRNAADSHQPSAGDDEVMVEIGYGEKIYDSCPLDHVAEKSPVQAGLGVRNWIRLRDGERMIEVGSVAGRKGAGITIELGPGISTSEY
jgi:hypothetical protein